MLAHWNNSLAGIHMFLHSDTLSWFWANQSALSAEQRSNKYQFDSLWFDPTGAWIHNLLEVSMLTITPSWPSVRCQLGISYILCRIELSCQVYIYIYTMFLSVFIDNRTIQCARYMYTFCLGVFLGVTVQRICHHKHQYVLHTQKQNCITWLE
jgi:hypothetical protein